MKSLRQPSGTLRTNGFDEQPKELMRVALGEVPASLVVQNARVLNVYTGELLEGWSVAVKGSQIACVGKDVSHAIGKDTRCIDAAGKTLIPGFIEGHTHLSWLFSPAEFLEAAIPGGTTTIVTETMEPYPVSGVRGVMDFIASTQGQPVKIFLTAPAMGSISKRAVGISSAALNALLKHPAVIGLGESYWQGVLQTPEKFLPAFEKTLRFRKVIEGHAAGAGGRKLNAYAALGPTSCHEPITAEQALERLRLGFWVMIREGSIRRDLSAISDIRATGIDTRRMILVTDGISPKDLLEKGGMEYVVQRAVDCGFKPVEAVQMATLNVAQRFCLEHRLGGIAPGRDADMILIPDIQTIRAELVISNGQVIAEKGKVRKKPRTHLFLKESLNSVHLKRDMTAKDFDVSTRKSARYAHVRVMEMVTDLVTRESEATLCVKDGKVLPDPAGDILKVAAVDRTRYPGKTFTGFIKGFCMKHGAIASSAAWDTSDIVVVGANESDMALAVNRIHALQGGAVVCAKGKVQAELALPIFGLMSDLPLKTLNRKLAAIHRAAAALGIPFPDPLLTLVTLTGAAIPFLRICEEGLVHLKDGQKRDLILRLKA
ncbi:MAG: adenine deaminase [Deltaproteobacteria bacterium]|nr:adenine deaminase [Deltaproteobacteria bacterium]MBW2042166.1 adenine deaminase [Deltaproteobacteria bacterium]